MIVEDSTTKYRCYECKDSGIVIKGGYGDVHIQEFVCTHPFSWMNANRYKCSYCPNATEPRHCTCGAWTGRDHNRYIAKKESGAYICPTCSGWSICNEGEPCKLIVSPGDRSGFSKAHNLRCPDCPGTGISYGNWVCKRCVR